MFVVLRGPDVLSFSRSVIIRRIFPARLGGIIFLLMLGLGKLLENSPPHEVLSDFENDKKEPDDNKGDDLISRIREKNTSCGLICLRRKEKSRSRERLWNHDYSIGRLAFSGSL